jgi:hypothetical protein
VFFLVELPFLTFKFSRQENNVQSERVYSAMVFVVHNALTRYHSLDVFSEKDENCVL